MEMMEADSEQRRELPLLAQLIHGSYQDRKTREGKGLAHDRDLGAGCNICGSECSGLELHFWRKVCKNCGCRPEQHNIKLNEAVHNDIVKDLFTAKSRNSSLSTDQDGIADKDASERRPSYESKKGDFAVPTIKVQSMTLEPDSNGYKHSGAKIKSSVPEVSTGKQPHTSIQSKPGISSAEATLPSVAMENKRPTEGVISESTGTSNTPKSPTNVSINSISNVKGTNLESVNGSLPSVAMENKKQTEDVVVPESPGTPRTPKSPTNVSFTAVSNRKSTDLETANGRGNAPLPPNRKDSFAEVERQRKLLNQLPPQDFDPKFCSTLNRKQKHAMHKMDNIKREAAGKGKLTGNENQQICRACNTEIGTGEKAVCSTYQKSLVYWHQGCFKCKSCQEAIVDYIYFWHEGNIYCGRHFSEKYRPRCAGCDELIFADRYTIAEGQSWHLEHFTCFKCDRSLADTNYISHKGQPHCMTCYHYNIASKCASCGLPIQVGEQRISYNNSHWHACSECFFCRGCNKNLVDFGFLLFNDKLYCSKRCSSVQ